MLKFRFWGGPKNDHFLAFFVQVESEVFEVFQSYHVIDTVLILFSIVWLPPWYFYFLLIYHYFYKKKLILFLRPPPPEIGKYLKFFYFLIISLNKLGNN